jgi:hypothetical protein
MTITSMPPYSTTTLASLVSTATRLNLSIVAVAMRMRTGASGTLRQNMKRQEGHSTPSMPDADNARRARRER